MRLASRLMGIVFLAGLVSVAVAQEASQAEFDSLESAALEEAQQKLGASAKPHPYMNALVGTCKTAHVELDKDGKEVSVVEGTAEFKSIQQGHWVTQSYQRLSKDRTIESFSVLGYDGEKQKFVGLWIDKKTPFSMPFEGQLDDKTGILKEIGTQQSLYGPILFIMVA
ncbi:hypothetical protein C5Y96_14265 [Blastopirellula marina]|uniref:Uncharacterized protein n=1 Tax=Blastopirellula marina TaxID=124 RepID=A0A2S8FEW8_9BACT|nr:MULTISPECIES: DUF1579 family protein [Pirellulaceae]PQO30630.1 hypothetical protein C5Y96_14265 [Blastopirellula marina]RCS50767.1 DUF1579 domain-containing protein [Bremerella cremea]